MLGFEHLKSLYQGDSDFGKLLVACQVQLIEDFMLQGGYLFKGTRLCTPKCGTRELILREVHGQSIAGHSGETRPI